MQLSKTLKQLLKERDLTVAKIARSTKISSKTLYQWLNGQSPRNLNNLKVVADFFGVTVDYLLFGVPVPIPETNAETKEGELVNFGSYDVFLRKIKK